MGSAPAAKGLLCALASLPLAIAAAAPVRAQDARFETGPGVEYLDVAPGGSAAEAASPTPAPSQLGDFGTQIQKHWGRLLEAVGDNDTAQRAYERILRSGRPDAPTLWRLGLVLQRRGDAGGAEKTWLSTLQLDPNHVGARRELGALYMERGDVDTALTHLRRAVSLDPGDPSARRLLLSAEKAAAAVAEALDDPWRLRRAHRTSQSEAAERPEPIELLTEVIHDALPPGVQRQVDRARRLTATEEGRMRALLAALGVLVFWFAMRMARGPGDLTVALEYPSELRGTFTVRASRRKGSSRRGPRVLSPRDAAGVQEKAPVSNRYNHYLVGRETRFAGVPARNYHVCVEGFLQDVETGDVVRNVFEEKEERVRRGQTVRLEFDFRARLSPVDVKVLWDKRPVQEARVSVLGIPNSMRFARSAPARLSLPMGKHTILVGCGDRVVEREFEVTSVGLSEVEIDLAGRENVVFTGCPPAMELYLNGDAVAAARALERDGQTQVANAILARLYAERGQTEQAATHYEAAEQPARAAELRASLSDFAAAAALFAQAGDALRAAEAYRSAGDMVRAGEAFESVKRWADAAECFREAGEVPRWVRALERRGEFFQAAKVSIEHEDWSRAIRLLQQVEPGDPHHLEACGILTDAYEREGHLDLAAQKLEEWIGAHGREGAPLEMRDRLAHLLEKAGDYERALEVLEAIRQRDVTFPDLATRIEDVRKKRSSQDLATTKPAGGAGGDGDDQLIKGSRYEILEQIGRGGMGIVFKARDRRLGRIVALKRLPDNLSDHPKAVKLFLREARAAAALNHPNVVTLFDADNDGDMFFITMELLEGMTLQSILTKRGKLSPRDISKLGGQVAAGLAYAHGRGIVHRDIKTTNLFFTNDRVLKIMDFGLAKMVEEVRRASTVIGGTPYYMAPEQALGQSVDHRADIYALGVTLFELATGQVPFSEGDVVYHHRHTAAPDPRERAEGIPDALAELILHMMEKKPDARCASAAEVGERLAAL